MKLELHVSYKKDGETIEKTRTAETVELEFGTIRNLMGLLDIEDVNDTTQLLRKVNGAWEEITSVLSDCFPDMEDEDWDHVKLKELIPVTLSILKSSFAEILSIPNDSKN